MKIIYIVASNIKGGGAEELLYFIINHLSKNYTQIKVKIYADPVLKLKSTNNIEIIYQKSKLDKIMLFSKKLENVLYFGNLPPLVKSKNSIVYFHNSFLVMDFNTLLTKGFSLFVKYSLQRIYIKYFIENVDLVACQTKNIKQLFIKQYDFHNVDLLPFFRVCDKNESKTMSKKYDFCYVSLAYPHKNHKLLFDAMNILAHRNVKATLVVTIEDDKEELLDIIDEINEIGIVHIDNLGLMPKNEVCNVYRESNCLCFPSFEETFGLPLIEAAMMGLDVIASDLDYVYQVIKPSLVFDPDDAEDVADKIEEYLQGNFSKSECLVENKIDELIKKLL